MAQRDQDSQRSTGMGTGPVLGGKAGGQDYSLSSMLERAPYKTKEGQEGGANDLDSKLSAGEQDLLAGSGTVEGADGNKPAFNIRMSGLPKEVTEQAGNAGNGAAQEVPAPSLGDPKMSAGEHDLLAGSGLVDGAEGRKPAFNMKMSGFPEDDAAAGGAKAGAPTGLSSHETNREPQVSIPQDTSSFSKDEKSLLRGQGLMSLKSGPAPPDSCAADDALNKEERNDELREEQSEVPASEFDKQPSSMESVKQKVAESQESIARVVSQVAETVKQTALGNGHEE